MSWFEVIRHDTEERIDIIAKSGFMSILAPKEIADVVRILDDVLSGNVAAKLFEGLVSFEVDAEKLKIGFTFSINPEHMAKIEESTGLRELTDHRVTFVMFVFANIDLEYPLDTSLPEGFRQTLDMDEYIQ